MVNWEENVKKYGAAVWQCAYRLLGDHAETSDCFSETFVSAWEISQHQNIRKFGPLLIRIATTKAIDRIRRRMRRSRLGTSSMDITVIPSSEPGPVKNIQQHELANKLRNVLRQLPAKEAEVFCLRYLNDMSYRQIAKVLGTKTNTVGVLLHRARTKLRKLFNPNLQR